MESKTCSRSRASRQGLLVMVLQQQRGQVPGHWQGMQVLPAAVSVLLLVVVVIVEVLMRHWVVERH